MGFGEWKTPGAGLRLALSEMITNLDARPGLAAMNKLSIFEMSRKSRLDKVFSRTTLCLT